MRSIENTSVASPFCAGLIGLAMTCCPLGMADAGSKLMPSEQFPGPWLEVTLRDQGRPHPEQGLWLQPGHGAAVLAGPRRISVVLHER